MHGFQCAQRLVDEILAVVIGQVLCADYSVHVSFHQFLSLSALSSTRTRETLYLNEVDLCEAIITTRSLNIENRDDVLMVEISQQLHLSQSSQAKHGVIERGDFLDGDFLA